MLFCRGRRSNDRRMAHTASTRPRTGHSETPFMTWDILEIPSRAGKGRLKPYIPSERSTCRSTENMENLHPDVKYSVLCVAISNFDHRMPWVISRVRVQCRILYALQADRDHAYLGQIGRNRSAGRPWLYQLRALVAQE